jgi:hypothetical protein
MEYRSIYSLDIESIQYFSQYLWEKDEKKRDEFNFRLLNGPVMSTSDGKRGYYDRLMICKSINQENTYIFKYKMTVQKDDFSNDLTYIINTDLLPLQPFTFLFYLFYLSYCLIFS